MRRELDRLVEVELVYQRGLPPQATYTFKHALIQETAYQSLLRSTRQQYHQHLVQVLVDQFPEKAEAQPELLAHHYTEAGQNEIAISYWQQAGQQAIQRSAHQEAIAHLTKGLEMLTSLPESSERTRRELAIQTALGPVLSNTQGWSAPDVEHTYIRALELCQQLNDPTQLFRVQRGLFYLYYTRGELQRAQELGKRLLTLAQRQQDSILCVVAHQSLGSALLMRGEVIPARSHFEQGVAYYDRQAHRDMGFLYGLDAGIACVAYDAWDLWLLGYQEQALQRSDDALSLAQEASHQYTRAFALCWSVLTHGLRREWQASYERADAMLVLAGEQGFVPLQGLGIILRAWALAKQGQPSEDMTRMYEGLDVIRAGIEFLMPTWLYMLAEVHDQAGQTEEGLNVLAEALAKVEQTGERWFEAELYRFKGALLLKQAVPDAPKAEACFHQALDVARHQHAKSWELRAATSLARLWQSQAKRQDAYELLAPVNACFTEGFDTADLKDAKALLDGLCA